MRSLLLIIAILGFSIVSLTCEIYSGEGQVDFKCLKIEAAKLSLFTDASDSLVLKSSLASSDFIEAPMENIKVIQ